MTILQDEMAALLSPYLDGELSAGDRDRVEAHLAKCLSCRAELEALRESNRLLLGLGAGIQAEGLETKLRRRIRRQVARLLVGGFVVGILVAVLLGSVPAIAASLQPALPLWFRVARGAALILLGVPLFLWAHQLLSDLSSLVVYGWLNPEDLEVDR